MKFGIYFGFFIIFFFGEQAIFSQDTIVKPRKVKVLPLPAFGYSPETRTYLGAVSLFTIDLYNDSLTRTSNAKIEFNYTWNHQIILESDWNYFFRNEDWFTKGLLHFSKYPDLYYGLGPKTTYKDEVSFNSVRLNLNAELLKRVGNKIYAGIGLKYIQYDIPDGDDFQLMSNKTIGFKISGVLDARNNLLTANKGHYISVSNTYNSSNSFYSQVEVDLRKYFSFGKRVNTVALMLYQMSVLGDAPFYDLATIGGDKIARGYRFGRFRANNLSNMQFEYRTPIWWRIGFAGFGGCALIYDAFNEISSVNFKPNFGGGLRFLVDKNERTSLRFDYGIGRDGQRGFYISFGEAF